MMKKSVKIIFTISLLLNLALIGVIGGGLYQKYQRHKPPSELSEQARKTMKENMKQSRALLRERFKEAREYHQELKDIMGAPKFDRAAYDDTVDKILNHKDGVARQKAIVMGQTLESLSQEERQEMSKHVLKTLSGKNKRSDRHKKRPSPREE